MSYFLPYIIDTFKRLYRVNKDLKIGYDEDSHIRICSHSGSFFDQADPFPKHLTRKEWKGTSVPFLFHKSNEQEIITVHEKGLLINYDILANAFYFLSSWQEFHSPVRDSHGRYPYSESLQARHDFITLPVVNYYFDILKTAIEQYSGTPVQRLQWPQYDLALSITHDIDKINSGWKEGASYKLRQGRLLPAGRLLLEKSLGKKDPWNNLSEIVRMESDQGIRSTFFFLAEKGQGNADYTLAEVRDSFRKIRDSGSETALHGSFGTSGDPEKLNHEISSLGNDTRGNRFHFLKVDPLTFGDTIEATPLRYDASLGFAEHVGFRNGICFPFIPYNLKHRKPYSFAEIPLMIMDGTLENPSYMGNDPEKMLKAGEVISEARKFNGLLSILWHNNYYSEVKYQGWKDVLMELLAFVQDETKAAFMTCSEIADSFLPSDDE